MDCRTRGNEPPGILHQRSYRAAGSRAETHCYRLSVRFVELANICRFQRRFLWGASQPVQALAQETESVVHMGQLHGRGLARR